MSPFLAASAKYDTVTEIQINSRESCELDNIMETFLNSKQYDILGLTWTQTVQLTTSSFSSRRSGS